MIEQLLEQLTETPLLDWIATAIALLYVWLAGRDNNWCWVFAAVSSLLYAHQVLVVYALPSDAALQLFYFVMALVGLYRWRKLSRTPAAATDRLDDLAFAKADDRGSHLHRMTATEHAWMIVVGLAGGLLFGQVVVRFYAGAALPLLDAMTTVFSVLATFLLIGRRLENWLYFVVIDAVYVYIYGSRGAYLYAVLMLIYIAMAIVGYYRWRNLLAVDRGYQSAA